MEKTNLIRIIQRLIQAGNTVVCVEHDESFMREADYIIDVGPGAGVQGGYKIYEGGFEEFLECKASKTAPYLKNRSFPVKKIYRTGKEERVLTIKNASLHNLQDVEAKIPLGVMVGIAGVSGSGKSSLISDTLVPCLKEQMKRDCITNDDRAEKSRNESETEELEACEWEEEPVITETQILGVDQIKRCFVIDQRPIGRSRTSCPATYTGIMDRVRNMYANTEQAKELGFGNFIDVKCEKCDGYGFVPQVMGVCIDGKNIRDVLDFSVDEAYEFFAEKDAVITNILNTLKRVGMGYIKLGQATPTISGGESQRIKLAKELSKGKLGKNCLYILDEPTTGLSFSDSEKLLELLNELVDKGNSIIITEHDPYILSNCDWILEMGPGGGKEGGSLIAEGTPEELKKNPASIIREYLK